MKSVILLGHRRVLWSTVIASCLLSVFIVTMRSSKLLSRFAAVSHVAQGSHFNPAASSNPESRIPNPGYGPPAVGLATTAGTAQPRLVESYGKLPLSFEINKGQADSQVKFLSRGSGYSLFLTGNEAVLALRKGNSNGKRQMAKGVAQRSPFNAAAFPGLLRWPTAELEINARTADPRTGSALQGLLQRPASFQSPVSNFQTPATNDEPRTTSALLRMKLVGANPHAKVSGLEELPGRSNYFIGSDPKEWRTNVPNYAKVKYANVYPGVDLVYYGNQGKLEYDFVVQPGADPRQIALDVGAGLVPAQGGHPQGVPLRIGTDGDLVVTTDGGEVTFHKPIVYQPTTYNEPRTTNQELVESKYAVKGDQVSFEVASYDKRRPIVIDPVLAYSTYLGGSYEDWGSAIALDASGNTYVAGSTHSSDFPTAPGASRSPCVGTYLPLPEFAFVSKLNAAGTLVYSTYLGGCSYYYQGELYIPDSYGQGITVDASGNAYVTGTTQYSGFPTTPGAFQTANRGEWNAFVSKLTAAGSGLPYSTYLGGSGRWDGGNAIAVDSSGNAYVTGQASSYDFPVTPGAFQTTCGSGRAPGTNDCIQGNNFVSKLNSAGSALTYSTFLSGSGADWGSGIAVDASGNAYVTGAASADFPTTPGAFQDPSNQGSFVTKLNAAGSTLVYSTSSIGGSAIALDSAGDTYITGSAYSSDFPTTPSAFQTTWGGGSDAFISKLNATGAALLYSTYLGGTGGDGGSGIAVDAAGNAYVTGSTSSSDFPITPDAFQTTYGGNGNAFISKLNAAGSALLYSTYLGGTGGDGGSGIAVDAAGNAYVAGGAGSDFPTTPGAFQTTFAGFGDAFISKFCFATGGVPAVRLTPGSVSFPVLRIVETTSLSRKVRVTNVGCGELDVAGITVTGPDPGDFAQSNNCTPTVASGGSCVITVTFTPTAQGVRTASVSITDSAPGSPQTVRLTGRGTFFEWSPRSLNMGDHKVGTSSAARTVTLTNAGTTPITLFSIEMGGVNPDDFTQTNTCGSSLNPGASCTIQVTFTPTAVGSRLGHVAISDNAFGGTHWVGLLGKGT
jgi:hypothetical protein